MAKYKVIKNFLDGEDNKQAYGANGGLYPREGLNPSSERVQSLIDKGYIEEQAPEVVQDKPTEDWTKPKIQEYLDDEGIEYNKSANKDELLALVGG